MSLYLRVIKITDINEVIAAIINIFTGTLVPVSASTSSTVKFNGEDTAAPKVESPLYSTVKL